MRDISIAIQTNVWGPEYHGENMPRMLTEIAAAGYDGFEIGAHRIENLARPEPFLSLVIEHGLQVAGLHTLGKRYFEQVQKGDLSYPIRAAEFARAVGSKHLLASGEYSLWKNASDGHRLADTLNRVGEICQSQSVIFSYHNHWWEIENQQQILRTLLADTEPDLVSLCLDIGWVERAGAAPGELVSEFLERIRYLHLKDTQGDSFTELGFGSVDINSVLSIVRGNTGIHLTVERDEVLPHAFESALKSREFLRGHGI